MASSFASTSSMSTISLSTTSHTRGVTLSDLDLATTSLSSTSITIVPLSSIDRVRLLSGIYGPFRPPTPTKVPLWVALHLKKRRKALLVPPTWLTLDALTETLKHETTQPGFSPLPPYWIGISQTLLANAPDDIPNSNRVRALLKDIREARQSKILTGVPMLNPVHLQMHNISTHEVAELRAFFSTAFSQLKSLRAPTEVDAEAKLQAELDERNRWALLPPLPQSLRPVHGLDESMAPNQQDESFLSPSISAAAAAADATSAVPRKSNVSDSGYYSAPARASTSQSTPPPPQPHPQSSSHPNRPPRFDVDQDSDQD